LKKLYFLVSAAVVLLDLLSKQVIINTIKPYETVPVLPFFSIVNVANKGAAFGSLQWVGNPFFIVITLIAVAIVIYLMIKDREHPLGLSLILGGAIGNLIDRFRFGHVVDFLDLHAGKYHWPAFNVADSALTVGITILLVQYVFLAPKKGAQ